MHTTSAESDGPRSAKSDSSSEHYESEDELQTEFRPAESVPFDNAVSEESASADNIPRAIETHSLTANSDENFARSGDSERDDAAAAARASDLDSSEVPDERDAATDDSRREIEPATTAQTMGSPDSADGDSDQSVTIDQPVFDRYALLDSGRTVPADRPADRVLPLNDDDLHEYLDPTNFAVASADVVTPALNAEQTGGVFDRSFDGENSDAAGNRPDADVNADPLRTGTATGESPSPSSGGSSAAPQTASAPLTDTADFAVPQPDKLLDQIMPLLDEMQGLSDKDSSASDGTTLRFDGASGPDTSCSRPLTLECDLFDGRHNELVSECAIDVEQTDVRQYESISDAVIRTSDSTTTTSGIADEMLADYQRMHSASTSAASSDHEPRTDVETYDMVLPTDIAARPVSPDRASPADDSSTAPTNSPAETTSPDDRDRRYANLFTRLKQQQNPDVD